jgi:hypothetical protein
MLEGAFCAILAKLPDLIRQWFGLVLTMQKSDWALIISLCSTAIALFSLGWNVWSKFIYPKPKVQVGFNYMTVIGQPKEEVLVLSATNMGPIEVMLHSALVQIKKRYWSRPKYGLLSPLHGYPNRKDQTIGPFSGGLPKTLGVGQQFSVYFIPDHEMLAGSEYDRIGFHDTFGRYHWAGKKGVRMARQHIREACDKAGKSYK